MTHTHTLTVSSQCLPLKAFVAGKSVSCILLLPTLCQLLPMLRWMPIDQPQPVRAAAAGGREGGRVEGAEPASLAAIFLHQQSMCLSERPLSVEPCGGGGAAAGPPLPPLSNSSHPRLCCSVRGFSRLLMPVSVDAVTAERRISLNTGDKWAV